MPVDERAARQRRLLDAGLTPLLAERPWAELRMADVAAAAGVSRQTLYAEFGSRQGLARAYVDAEADRFLAMVDGALAAHPGDISGALGAALETFLTAARQGGLLAAVVRGEGNEELLALLTTRGGDVLEVASGRLEAWFAREWPAVPVDQARLVARTLVRLALSHATLPDAPPAETAAGVAALFGPRLEQLVGERAGSGR